MKAIYLATPYWHDDPDIRRSRYDVANMVAGEIMKQGYVVFSPISHSHPIQTAMGDQQDHSFWLTQDFYWLDLCDELWVMVTEGWKKSYGVRREIVRASEQGKPVVKIKPKDYINKEVV